MKSCFEMKHATATSERERERAKQKGGNFYYKRISHTNTHNIEWQEESKERNRGKEAHEKMKLKRQTTKKVGNLMRKATKQEAVVRVCVCE